MVLVLLQAGWVKEAYKIAKDGDVDDTHPVTVLPIDPAIPAVSHSGITGAIQAVTVLRDRP